MRSPAITIEAWMSVYEAAWLMSAYDVNRLPVVDRDELVGVVTRSDLVRYFARSDHDVERDVRQKIALLESPRITVVAKHGSVLLEGELESAADLACLSHLVARRDRRGLQGDVANGCPHECAATGVRRRRNQTVGRSVGFALGQTATREPCASSIATTWLVPI